MKNVLIPTIVLSLIIAGVSIADVTSNAQPVSPSTVPQAVTPSQEQGVTNTMTEQKAVITTSKGIIAVEFYPKDAPETVANFVKLSKEGFYNNLKFHRVIPGFVAQGGDPQTKGEMGKDWTADPSEAMSKKIPLAGTGGPGYNVKAEFNAQKHLAGTLSMARSADPNSAGSQFYICLAPQPHLDGSYTVFGKVTSGMEAVLKLDVGDTIQSIIVEEAVPAAETATANAVEVTANAAVTGNSSGK